MSDKITVISNYPDTQCNFKNKIINGDFSIWQRGESFSFDTKSKDVPLEKEYTADRAIAQIFGCAATYSKHVENNYSASLKIKMTNNYNDGSESVHAYVDYRQRLEFLHLYSGKELTLSFDYKSDGNGKDLEIWITRKYNSSDSELKTASKIIYLNNFFTNTEFNRYEISFKVPTFEEDGNPTYEPENSWLEIVIRHIVPDTSTPTIYLKDIQLEEGSVATGFEYVPYDVQLERCKRYYEKFTTTILKSVGPDDTFGVISYKEKRITPSIKLISPETGAIGRMSYYSYDNEDKKDIPIEIITSFTKFYLPNKTHTLIGNSNFFPKSTNDAMGTVTVELDAEL